MAAEEAHARGLRLAHRRRSFETTSPCRSEAAVRRTAQSRRSNCAVRTPSRPHGRRPVAKRLRSRGCAHRRRVTVRHALVDQLRARRVGPRPYFRVPPSASRGFGGRRVRAGRSTPRGNSRTAATRRGRGDADDDVRPRDHAGCSDCTFADMTIKRRPRNSCSLSDAIAFEASSGVASSTKPKPRDRPVRRSTTTRPPSRDRTARRVLGDRGLQPSTRDYRRKAC